MVHTQEDLAKFGYLSDRKLDFLCYSNLVSTTYVLIMAISISFLKILQLFTPKKLLLFYATPNLVSHQSGCCFLSLPFRLGIYNYFLPWEEDVCVLVNPIKVGNCMVFCYS